MDTSGAVPYRPRVREGLALEVVDGEAVLLDLRTGALHRCNVSATAVLRACDGRRTVDELATDLAEEHDVPARVMVRDVRAALRQLRAADLVRG